MNPQMPTLPTETRATESPVDIQEQVRRRAFDLYDSEGERTGMIWTIGCKQNRS